jgi:hypothetical protein
MARPSKYAPELREPAVRIVFEHAHGASVAVGDDSIRRRETWLHHRGATPLGAAGRA